VRAVTASGNGKPALVAGPLARDVGGRCVDIGRLRSQMEQTFQNPNRRRKAADTLQKCACVRMRS
jgi:hypothetical protein